MRFIRSLLLAFMLTAASSPFAIAQDDPEVEQLVTEVIATYPHDTAAYTQGLLLHEGIFLESTGKYGQSSLRKVDPQTGEVLQQQRISDQFFAEGLALVEDRLIQLSWREGYAFLWDLETLEPLGIYFYRGEGWGLCYDGVSLYMSDGSQFIYQRDPVSFRVLGEVQVMLNGEPIGKINELECVDDVIYANVYQTDTILRIDKATGQVTGVIDATNLLTPEEREAIIGADAGAVLNGIAYDPENDVFYLTGKFWDKVFEVRFVPAE